jgi:hemerythrin-like metal-binding protein
MDQVFRWKPEYAVNVPHIDEQHHRLFLLVDQLHRALRRREASVFSYDMFLELIAYTQYHFSDEERLMEQHQFPGLAGHVEEHRALKRRVLEFKAAYDKGDQFIPAEFLYFLEGWLTDHVLSADMKYAPFVAAEKAGALKVNVFSWNPEYAVKVPNIDEQHQKLFSLIGELHKALQRSIPAHDMFLELVAYTQYHFADEERLMQEHEFPGLAGHVEEHRELKRRLLEFKADYDKGNTFISAELLNFLEGWLTDHVRSADMKYAPFVVAEKEN